MAEIWSKVTNILVENGNISRENEKVYQYAIKSILILGMNVLISLIIGVVMDELFYCILFLVMIIPLRSDAGGYHAPNMWICYLVSFASLILTLLGVKNLQVQWMGIVITLVIISYIIILIFAPLESKNRPLREKDRLCIGRRAKIIVSIEFILGLLCLLFSIQAAYIVSSAIAWCGIGYIAWFVDKKLNW